MFSVSLYALWMFVESSKTVTEPEPNTSSVAYVESVDKSSKCPAIVGYIHDASPNQISKKGSPYFSFFIQEKQKVRKAICFPPNGN